MTLTSYLKIRVCSLHDFSSTIFSQRDLIVQPWQLLMSWSLWLSSTFCGVRSTIAYYVINYNPLVWGVSFISETSLDSYYIFLIASCLIITTIVMAVGGFSSLFTLYSYIQLTATDGIFFIITWRKGLILKLINNRRY